MIKKLGAALVAVLSSFLSYCGAPVPHPSPSPVFQSPDVARAERAIRPGRGDLSG